MCDYLLHNWPLHGPFWEAPCIIDVLSASHEDYKTHTFVCIFAPTSPSAQLLSRQQGLNLFVNDVSLHSVLVRDCGFPLISQPDITLLILSSCLPIGFQQTTVSIPGTRSRLILGVVSFVLILLSPSSVATSNDSILTPTENLDNPLGGGSARRDSQGVLQSPGTYVLLSLSVTLNIMLRCSRSCQRGRLLPSQKGLSEKSNSWKDTQGRQAPDLQGMALAPRQGRSRLLSHRAAPQHTGRGDEGLH